MKVFTEMACLLVLGTGTAFGGGIGGLGGGSRMAVCYDSPSYRLYIEGRLADRCAGSRSFSAVDYQLQSFSIDVNVLDSLQYKMDSNQLVNAKSLSGANKSYRVYPGDEQQQFELVDRREAIRSGR